MARYLVHVCRFCGLDVPKIPGETENRYIRRHWCSPSCHVADRDCGETTARVHAWLKADIERRIAVVHVPVRPSVARPGFGRSPIVINDQRGAPESQVEEAAPVEVEEL